MGDVGVACMPLQHIMERVSIPETLCGGKNNGNSSSNGFSTSKSLKKKTKKLKSEESVKKVEAEKSDSALDKGGKNYSEVEKGEIVELTEEVEEGELGTLKWPRSEVENGEFVTPKWRRSEIEKGEILGDKWRKNEVEKGEIVPGKWRKGELEKGEIVPEKLRKGDAEKGEFGSWRSSKDEIEKGEFIPDRWQKEVARDEYGYSKPPRFELGKDKIWKPDHERTPPFGKYPVDDISRRKEYNRSNHQHNRNNSRWELGHERNSRLSSKIVDDEDKNECSNDKTHGREYSGNRLKRHGTDTDSSDRKHYGDYSDFSGSKSRRLSDDNGRGAHSEHPSRRSMERSYRNPSLNRISSGDKYSSRHYDSSLSSRVSHDRQAPGHSERSPRDRARHHDHRDRSPVRREKSPHGREKSPYNQEKSPYERSKNHDHRNRSPVHADRSPQDRSRLHDRRDRTPNYLERSPLDKGRPNTYREANRRSGSEKQSSQHSNKEQEEKVHLRDPKEAQDKSSVASVNGPVEKSPIFPSDKDEHSQMPGQNCTEHVNEAVPEEMPSMEEDMDICDTPPHVPMGADSMTGKWFYLDYFGTECGPSKLCDLKALVEGGVLVSDHLVKHLDSDRWVTLENAASPLVAVNFPSIVPETISQLASPPEAPRSLLADSVDNGQSCSDTAEVTSSHLSLIKSPGDSAPLSPLEDLHIDERVGVLLEGVILIPGREVEILGEVLQVTLDYAQWERWGNSDGFTWQRVLSEEKHDQQADELASCSDISCKEAEESRISLPPDSAFPCSDSVDWFSGYWSCKGGDWMRNDEAAQDRFLRKKLVVNDGFPLCQMPKSGCEDPRWRQKDELYHPSQSRSLDLPSWAFSCPDERSDCNGVSKLAPVKPIAVRGVKGTMLPVVRINACVVKDHGSFVSEPRAKVRGKERQSSRSSRPHSSSSDLKRSSAERNPRSKTVTENDTRRSLKHITSINTPKDRLCTVDDLQVHLGEWYYLDGAGRERGPSSFSQLQVLVDQGVIQKYSSVFRKFDKVWVPITSAAESSEGSGKIKPESKATLADESGDPVTHLQIAASCERNAISSLFHTLHPQFIGFTCGKLHELVMKSYKSREFAAAINEVLDPWINAKQPKKELDKHVHWKSGDTRPGKRARLLVDDSESDYEMEEDLQRVRNEDSKFEDLCGDATFSAEESVCSSLESRNWGLLDGHMLARVFHFLRCDLKSLVFASLTCKHWRAAIRFYKDISRQVDLSLLGPNCNDSMIWDIMGGYDKERISSLVLIGCTNITAGTLEEILRTFPHVYSIDVRGCSQFGELVIKFPIVNWIKSRNSIGMGALEDLHPKMRTLKQMTELTSSTSKLKSLGTNNDDYGELKDYFDSVDRRDSANQLFRRSLYKRSKLFDARKSSSILSRDARMRRWTMKKSENRYKKMEDFLASSLKDIMRGNAFDFFVPKVAEIQEKMKNGYYMSNGLSSVKDDISRMCRDAIKAKNRGDAKDMNHVITLFIQLATRLEGGSKSSHERDEMMKSWKPDSRVATKYRKNPSKTVNGRKYMNRNDAYLSSGGSDYGYYASDREIRRRLSKLNKRSMDSESETSDDMGQSSEDGKTDGETTASDTESDSDMQTGRTGESRENGYFSADETFDSMTDDREWGARMTKASLVPPVTRKYEVIDQYVIVADEEDVQRKMRVSLPDDYAEKVLSQKNGTEESDMELPEVKDYKPRKQLGDEVIEQEVYGIDPYTHNLLLDSMPEELGWSQQDKHAFIEDVLLSGLNKQVRDFTGSGNTPMIYPLKPVIEGIKISAGEGGDIRTSRMCQRLLKAIDERPDDNYVAYRKGLGVVCNKEGGFGEDDFVVEFLGEVYPVWRWYEKQDGILSLQKDSKEPAPEFYNINLERPKGDADGYDLVVVDAMHKANYASRICHSCRPNCEAKVTAVDGQYQIGIYSVRKIRRGEEITFDYNSVTESKEEYEASVCLCGSQVCRGSYLNLTGEGAFQKVLKEWHGMLNRHQLMLEACELNSVADEDVMELQRAGLGTCLLGGLPQWLIAYSARLVRFINFERTKLPDEILKHNLEEKRKYFSEICMEVEKSDAEVQAEGVYNQRLQNLAQTLDKVRYVMRRVFGDPKKAPPPLEKLSPEAMVAVLWKGEGSLVQELLQCIAPYVVEDQLNDLEAKIQAHDPSDCDNIRKGLKKSLLWLRDEVRNLTCTYKSRHDAAADLIHIYAYTKYFFRIRDYEAFTSPPVCISTLDLGPKSAAKLGSGFKEYSKTYGENYCLGQLIYWHNQTNAEPDCSLARASRGCLSLPEIGSFYAKLQKPSRQRVYGPKTLRFMLTRMEKQPHRPWPKDKIWSFKSSPKVIGSPMLDAVINNSSIDREMMHWLKSRPAVFQAMWDR